MKNLFKKGLIVVLFIVAYLPAIAFAGAKPEIMAHSANFMGSAVNFSVQWQSPYPVTSVNFSLAGVVEKVEVDEYDNRRNYDGYSGEISLDVPLPQDVYFDGKKIAYVIQVEDELRQKSAQTRGQVLVVSKIDAGEEQALSIPDRPEINMDAPEPRDGDGDGGDGGDGGGDGEPVAYVFLVDLKEADTPGYAYFEIRIENDAQADQIEWHVLNDNDYEVVPLGSAVMNSSGLFETGSFQLDDGYYTLILQPILEGTYGDEVRLENIPIYGLSPNITYTFTVEAIPSGTPNVNIINIYIENEEIPDSIQWHVLGDNDDPVTDPSLVDEVFDKKIEAGQVSLGPGTYTLVAKPTVGGRELNESRITFIVNDQGNGNNGRGTAALPPPGVGMEGRVIQVSPGTRAPTISSQRPSSINSTPRVTDTAPSNAVQKTSGTSTLQRLSITPPKAPTTDGGATDANSGQETSGQTSVRSPAVRVQRAP